ncbi:MAG TPA: gamma-glutamyl-gamma-aminobutyrate hydrolase family protein, partial [Candidatus Polarisedimenticolia bacterium]|nr:gamma-glutamyl-gamma-aminobutyrate hydrolase family protein [Candidatus Polarisedimenticolia bacterium]
HGKTSPVTHDGDALFAGIPSPLRVTRYHSLVVANDNLPGSLRVTARSDDGVIMALRHRELPITGVQFHPEAVLTEHGHRLLQNFLDGHAWQ